MQRFKKGTIVIKPESRTKILDFDEAKNEYIVCDVNNEKDKWEVGIEYAHKNYQVGPSDFKERLLVEMEDLRVRTKKLRKFIDGNETFQKLSDEERFLMKLQHKQMLDLHQTLYERYSILHRKFLDTHGQVE